MKVTLNSRELLKALTFVNKGISKRNSLPILDCFLIEQRDGKLKVKGGNEEINSSYILEADGEDGKCAVVAKTLIDAVKSLPDTGIRIEVGDALTCDYNSGRFKLPILNHNEYPTFEDVDTDSVIISNINLTKMAQFTADDELRPVMNGVYFDLENGYYCASDGHTLIRVTTEVQPVSFICTKQSIRLIENLEQFELRLGTKFVQFNHENIEVKARIIEGRYPNYNSVIPLDNPIKVEVDRLSLINAVKRVSVLSGINGLVRFKIENNKIELTTQDIDFSTSAKEELTCNGGSITIGFKAEFIIRVLNALNEDTVTLEMKDEGRALVIEEDNTVVLLMPMML